MILRPRVLRHALRRCLQALSTCLLLWTAFDVWTVRHAARRHAATHSATHEDLKIFIPSLHWTDEAVLRSHWNSAIVQLAKDLGPSNVFISIHEGGSFDDTAGALRALGDELLAINAPHEILLNGTSHEEEVSRAPSASGWIQMPETKPYRQSLSEWFTLARGEWVPRRIPYLARLRDKVMQPLYEQQKNGIKYDIVLWLNDVVFTTKDVLTLLSTRNGDYAAACALDFKQAPAFYDTFALRDAKGFAPLSTSWPYFQSAQSRHALIHSEPIPVASCWNGMLAFDAAPFYHAENPLSFRGIQDDLAKAHLEGSESCLIHADNSLSAKKGVWVNPQVRVGYDGATYDAVNARVWPATYDIITGLWRNRIVRWFHFSDLYRKRRVVAEKLRAWKGNEQDRDEVGAYCLIDEMQILLRNGWGHV